EDSSELEPLRPVNGAHLYSSRPLAPVILQGSGGNAGPAQSVDDSATELTARGDDGEFGQRGRASADGCDQRGVEFVYRALPVDGVAIGEDELRLVEWTSGEPLEATESIQCVDRRCPAEYRLPVAIVHAQQRGASAHVDTGVGRSAPTLVHLLLAVADEQQRCVVTAAGDGMRQPEPVERDVLDLIDDDHAVGLLVRLVAQHFERQGDHV